MREREVDSKIAISEGEYNYLSDDAWGMGANEEYDVVILRAPNRPALSRFSGSKKADQAYDRVLKGE